MSLAIIDALLRERIGLNPESVGPHMIKDAASRRMTACRETDIAQYAARLLADDHELDELLEEVVVLESWFFRDLSPFRCLSEFVDEWRRLAGATQPVRVLSVPCGRGEEPFSIVMTLLDRGLDSSQFEVVGVDLSGHALQAAATGRFGPPAFRERDETAIQSKSRFFRPVAGEQFELTNDVRAAVRFLRGNLADKRFLNDDSPFDVIFCRNLLIYLAPEARQVAMQNVLRLLSPNGLAYFGHTETRLAAEHGMQVWNETYVAGLTRAKRDVQRERGAAETEVVRRQPGSLTISARGKIADVARPTTTGTDELSIMERAALLTEARRAANAGRLEQAARLCERILSQSRPVAEVFCLLGVVREALGEVAAAEECFQRALYLDQRHRESLIHLSLLCQLRGDAQSAANYGRRADRVTEEKQ